MTTPAMLRSASAGVHAASVSDTGGRVPATHIESRTSRSSELMPIKMVPTTKTRQLTTMVTGLFG